MVFTNAVIYPMLKGLDDYNCSPVSSEMASWFVLSGSVCGRREFERLNERTRSPPLFFLFLFFCCCWKRKGEGGERDKGK